MSIGGQNHTGEERQNGNYSMFLDDFNEETNIIRDCAGSHPDDDNNYDVEDEVAAATIAAAVQRERCALGDDVPILVLCDDCTFNANCCDNLVFRNRD